MKDNIDTGLKLFTAAFILSFVIALALIGDCMHSVVNEDVAWCEKL